MPLITIKEAADSTGKSKPTILRAIQSGRISAQRDAFGQWMIDPSELYRVYDPAPESGADVGDTHSDNASIHIDADESPPSVEIRLLRELLERLLAERDLRIASLETINEGLENVVSDLMVRLDQEAADRRRAYAQLTNLLTDQRPATEKGRLGGDSVRRWWVWRK